MRVTATSLFLALVAAGCSPSSSPVQQPAPQLAGSMATAEEDIAWLDSRIAAAQHELQEFERLHDIRRLEVRAEVERHTLASLMSELRNTKTAIATLEAEYPRMKESYPEINPGYQLQGSVSTNGYRIRKVTMWTAPAERSATADVNRAESVPLDQYRKLTAKRNSLEIEELKWQGNSAAYLQKYGVRRKQLQATLARLESTSERLADHLHKLRMKHNLKTAQNKTSEHIP